MHGSPTPYRHCPVPVQAGFLCHQRGSYWYCLTIGMSTTIGGGGVDCDAKSGGQQVAPRAGASSPPVHASEASPVGSGLDRR